jgi:hypothetical protein
MISRNLEMRHLLREMWMWVRGMRISRGDDKSPVGNAAFPAERWAKYSKYSYSHSRIKKMNTWDFRWSTFYRKDSYNFLLSKVVLKCLRLFFDRFLYIHTNVWDMVLWQSPCHIFPSNCFRNSYLSLGTGVIELGGSVPVLEKVRIGPPLLLWKICSHLRISGYVTLLHRSGNIQVAFTLLM